MLSHDGFEENDILAFLLVYRAESVDKQCAPMVSKILNPTIIQLPYPCVYTLII